MTRLPTSLRCTNLVWFLLAPTLVMAACVASRHAWAHSAGTTGYASVSVDGRTVRYALTLPADAMGGGKSLPDAIIAHVVVEADDAPCIGVTGPAQPGSVKAGNIFAVVLYACPAPVRTLRIKDGMDRLLGGDHHTIADVRWPNGESQVIFEQGSRSADIGIGPRESADQGRKGAADILVAHLSQGIEHILLGYDHLLFVIALILPGGSIGSLLAIVTAFTIAHSLTLALSVLGIFTLPGWIVEPVIALSIAYVGFENLYLRKTLSRRWGVSFLFGLVHGFGFAGALVEVGLPIHGLAPALVGFNLGVEFGQATVVAVALPLLLTLRRFTWQPRAVQLASVTIMALGFGLAAQRVLLT